SSPSFSRMRLHAIFFLLLCALAVADATPKCDRSLIKGVAEEKLHYDNASKTLTCRNTHQKIR
ncbi:hypothetical protein PMAYCL1PPCAC_03486, partial [Pristionchus mayeri]